MLASSQANIRESFKSMASNVAKTHKKCWPSLGHLIYEKPKRRSSGISNSSQGSNSPATPITPHDFSKARTQSFGGELNPKSSSEMRIDEKRNRADSYAVANPIPELVKKE